MNQYLIYDTYGEILRLYSGIEPATQVSGSEAYIITPEVYAGLTDFSAYYYNSSTKAITEKTSTDLSLASIVSLNDTVSFTVPTDCYVIVDNVITTSGTVTLNTSVVGGIYVRLGGKLLYKKTVKVVTYSERRSLEYPSIKDQLDLLYHSGIDGWKAQIKLTKDKYPK
tara:strand:+ start:1034 stop:1537 length:504 start_codon:yes stop_codon:yes gene_type:complete